MGFRVGDQVMHPHHGLGRILRMEERQLAEAELRQYYVLAFGKTTVWLPVQADRSGLRLLTAPQDLEHYRVLLQSRPTTLDRDYKKRHLNIQEQLAHGSFQEVCEVVRDLTALGWYRQITGVDAGLLKRARTDLWLEWSVATGQALPEVIQEVTALLEAGERAYKD